MIPKISDFGLARIIEIHEDQGSTNRIVGTYYVLEKKIPYQFIFTSSTNMFSLYLYICSAYMSPEYAMLGHFSEKSGVNTTLSCAIKIIIAPYDHNYYCLVLKLASPVRS